MPVPLEDNRERRKEAVKYSIDKSGVERKNQDDWFASEEYCTGSSVNSSNVPTDLIEATHRMGDLAWILGLWLGFGTHYCRTLSSTEYESWTLAGALPLVSATRPGGTSLGDPSKYRRP